MTASPEVFSLAQSLLFLLKTIEGGNNTLVKNGGKVNIKDRGGTRSGHDRRQNDQTYSGIERRTGRDRRKGFDRRSGLARRRITDRRNKNGRWDGSIIERRDIFRR
jgi:hypothetical protein